MGVSGKEKTLSEYHVKIYRFDPKIDSQGRYESYRFDFDYVPTILEVLRKIRNECDVNLAFRESCGLGKCGSCALSMNGKPVLACSTKLQNNAVIEPLKNHKIIKDLVIDKNKFYDKLNQERVFFNRPDYLKNSNEQIQWSQSFLDLSQCIDCLICESECPAFGFNSEDFSGPVSFARLSHSFNHPLNLGKQENIAWIDGIHNCTACMRCEHVCPKDVHPFRNGIIPLRAAISEENLEMPTTQKRLVDQYNKTGSLIRIRKDNKINHKIVDSKSKTAIFMGCMFTDRYPDEGKEILDLLFAIGVKAQIPDGLVCCGGPLLWIGDKKGAEKAFRKNIDILKDVGIERIITPCPGCGITLKNDYNNFYRKEEGEDMPFTILDMVELLKEGINDIAFKITDEIKRVCYHSPCHHGKGQGLLDDSLRVLKSLPGLEIVETEITENCCGGMASSSNVSKSIHLSSNIVTEAENKNADSLITNCVFCKDNLHLAALRKRSKVKVEHLLLVIERLRKKDNK